MRMRRYRAPVISIPAAFAARTVAREGDAGRAWLAQLPALIEQVVAAWNLQPDGPPMHGELGLAIPVRWRDQRCVLKVAWVNESTRHEALALATWNGRGAVRLLAARPEAGALLLERLDSTHSLHGLALDAAVEVAGTLLRRLAVPAPVGVPPQRAVVADLVASLPGRWERLDRPMARHLIDRAVAAAEALNTAGPTKAALLVNWDLNYENVLAGTREPWLVIDPKVVAGEPEYGVAQLFWTRLDEMDGRGGLRRCFDALVRAARLDAERARGWSIVRSVDYWLWGAGAGLTEDPKRCAALVEWLT